MTNFIGELKKRNVFKVAAIYVVVSWLLLQIVATVFPVFEIPMWASRLVVILLGMGFPIAVILAWAFELTPEGIEWNPQTPGEHVHTHAWDWILGLLLIIAISLLVVDQVRDWGNDGDTVVEMDEQPEQISPDEPMVADIEKLPSIAVLPFDNRSGDPADEYFTDGLSDELLSVLGRVDEIKVASRTSTAYFKNKDIDHATIADSLMVDHILSGTVRRDADRVRIIAALDDAILGELLWTDTYDRTMMDILDVQSEIAISVTTEIVPVLSPRSRTEIQNKPTENLEAYDYYLRGRAFLRQPAEEATLASARQFFSRAINLDANFAEAYAGQCDANLGAFEFSSSVKYFADAELSCQKALSLNAGLWEVHVALGNLYRIGGQLNKAVFELKAAIAQQPNAVDAYLVLAQIYEDMGLMDLAESNFLKAEKIEGGYWGVHRAFGNFLNHQSRYDEAIERHKRVIELAPDNGIGHDNLGNIYLAIGELDLARQAFDDSPLPSRWTHANRGLVFYYQHDFEGAVRDQRVAIDLAPDVHQSWGRLADAYRFIPGRDQEALSAYQIAIGLAEKQLAINPSDENVIVRLANYLVRTGRIDDAELQLQRLRELNLGAGDSSNFYFAAIAELALGDKAAAYDDLQKAAARGFSTSLINADPDLSAIRNEAAFRAIVGPSE